MAIIPLMLAASPSSAFADEAKDVQVYWGVGCFWHTQHEFINAEKTLLGRTDEQLTSRAGYAGGNKLGKDTNRPGGKGLACYHNMMNIADYGGLGHGEVVGTDIPKSQVKGFADQYFSLFKDNDRPDKGDRGGEYRSLIGLPGGVNSDVFPIVQAAAQREGLNLKLLEGKGDDPDTLGKKSVWVMDTVKFPFHQAEVYHQYHDGFMMGEQYPESYNQLGKKAYTAGRLENTGCPDTI